MAAKGLIDFFLPQAFGAVGNGVADDTIPVQAAIDAAATATGAEKPGGSLYLRGAYKITAPLLWPSIGAVNGNITTVNIYGDGPLASQLHWYGSTSGTFLTMQQNKRFWVQGVGFINKVAAGTTLGLDITNPVSGSNTGGGTFSLVNVSGFGTGILVGDAGTGGAASEILYQQLYLSGNTTGIHLTAQNSLAHVFEMLLLGTNGIGVLVDGPNSIYVKSGSASLQTTADFSIISEAGAYAISDFRTEDSNRFLTLGGGPASRQITVKGCQVASISNADDVSIELISSGTADQLNLIGNSGIKINLAATPGQQSQLRSLSMIGNTVFDSVLFNMNGAVLLARCQFQSFGNLQINSGGTVIGDFPDEFGEINTSGKLSFATFGPAVNNGLPSARVAFGVPLLAQVDNAVDIGAAGATRPRSIYAGTSVVTPSLSLGTVSPTAISNVRVYTPTLTPIAVAADVSAEQTFSVPGLTTADKVIVNQPVPTAGIGLAGARVSGADTLALTFTNPTAGALTPAAGVYPVIAIRS